MKTAMFAFTLPGGLSALAETNEAVVENFKPSALNPTGIENTPDFKEKIKVVFSSCGSRDNPGNINSTMKPSKKQASRTRRIWRRSGS